MKNHQYIRRLSVKELAELLVNEIQVDESEVWMCTYYESKVIDGLWMDYDDVLKETIDWLNADRKED